MSRYFFTRGLNPYDKDIGPGPDRELPNDAAAVEAGKALGADYVYLKLPNYRCSCVWKSDHVRAHEAGKGKVT